MFVARHLPAHHPPNLEMTPHGQATSADTNVIVTTSPRVAARHIAHRE
jgi:hypothetical protein